MASLKEVKTRISSVRSTRKITSAMKMVASSKLHKAQGAVENMIPYRQQLSKILTNFLSAGMSVESPYVKVREVKRVAIVVFSSDTTLCGAFNANVIKMLEHAVDEYRAQGQHDILLFPIGKQVEDAVQRMGLQPQEIAASDGLSDKKVDGTSDEASDRKADELSDYRTLSEKPSYKEASVLAQHLMQMYAAGEIDRVELIYHHFKSVGTQVLMRETYLPIDLTRMADEGEREESEAEPKRSVVVNDYIVEPSAEELIAQLIPIVLSQQLFTAAMDSNTSEHAARMLAMQVATDNANELIKDLTKQYNKSRQQAITNELLDIIGGNFN